LVAVETALASRPSPNQYFLDCCVVGWSAAGYEEYLATREQTHALLEKDAKAAGERVQPRDWIYRSWAIQSHDISQPAFKGDIAAAARSIRARVLLFPNCQDQLHPPREGGVLEVAQHIPVAKLVDVNDPGGYRWTSSPAPRALATKEIRDLLDRIAEGKPGISGPRFPRNWTRPDF
jgi:homoserine O-acetyltransferase/O-succinyltransferase